MPRTDLRRRLMRLVAALVGSSLLVGASIAGPASARTGGHRREGSHLSAHTRYTTLILASHPVGYWQFEDPARSKTARAIVGGVPGRYHDAPPISGVVGRARSFDGRSGYVTIPSRPAWSEPTTGSLSVEFWMRPARLVFSAEEGSGYVWILGKGEPGSHEWGFRMYGQDNRESPPRANRIAFYAFNASGGEGAGAYFQSHVVVGEWIYVVGELTGSGVVIFRDGVMTQGPPSPATLYANPRYHVLPTAGRAPVRVGTRNFGSYFAGSVDELAIYDRLLTPTEIRRHYLAGLASLSAG